MLSVKDLSDALGMSEHSVRRRIDALDGVLDDHIKRGDQQKIQVDSGGLEILRQLESLREEGLTIDEAVEEIREETGKNGSDNSSQSSANVREGEVDPKYVDQLERENRFLREQLEKKDRRIDQLLPGEVQRKDPLTRFLDWLF